MPSPTRQDVFPPPEAAFGRVIRVLGGLVGPPPVMRLLSSAREAALASVLPRARARAAALAVGLGRGDAEAAADYASMAEQSLREFWSEVAQMAREGAGATRPLGVLHALDLRFHRCDEVEHMDDPAFPSAAGKRLVQRLDRMNRLLGSYEMFLQAMRSLPKGEPMRSGPRSLRVLELAAGAGGFSLWLAREARRRAWPLEVIASDLRPEYLESARKAALAERLPLRILGLDALCPQAYPDEVDIVVCAQALHHFSPGLLALLFHRAAERASRGVLFVDGCRSLLLAGAFLGLSSLRFLDREYLHDAWISFRRFYLPEELTLLCGLGPLGLGATARFEAPGHVLVAHRPAAPVGS